MVLQMIVTAVDEEMHLAVKILVPGEKIPVLDRHWLIFSYME